MRVEYVNEVYVYLLANSIYNKKEDKYFFNYKVKKFTNMNKAINLYRGFASKAFQELINRNLIKKDKENKRYEIRIDGLTKLIDKQTFEKINIVFSKNTIKTYLFLYERFLVNNQKPFYISKDSLKDLLNYNKETFLNDYIIFDIMSILEKVNLISTYITQVKSKDAFLISNVSNHLSINLQYTLY